MREPPLLARPFISNQIGGAGPGRSAYIPLASSLEAAAAAAMLEEATRLPLLLIHAALTRSSLPVVNSDAAPTRDSVTQRLGDLDLLPG